MSRPQRPGTARVEPQPQDRFLLEDAHGKRQLDGAGVTPLWHQVPKISSFTGETQGCLPKAGTPGVPPFSWEKPSSSEMKPANKCIPESMFIRSDFSLL